MPITMQTYAHHILAIAEDHEIDVNPVHLQTVMYLGLKHMFNTHTALNELTESYQDDPFIMHEPVPVCMSVWTEFSGYGNLPIIDSFAKNESFYQSTNEILLKLLRQDKYALIKSVQSEYFYRNNLKNKIKAVYSVNNVRGVFSE